MSIDSHLERCLLVPTAELYSPGKYVNWNLSIFNGKLMIAMENFQSDLYGRTGTVQVKSGMSIENTQIPVNILPRTVQLCCLDQKTPFKMGIQWTYQT